MEAVGDGGMTRLYLIRHAEAEGNLYRVAHGHCNGLITNYRGYQQIDALRERFRKVDIDAVYSSDLYRTQITARAMCTEMVEQDLIIARRHALLKQHGFEVPVSLENA